jgi:hypothetical protein
MTRKGAKPPWMSNKVWGSIESGNLSPDIMDDLIDNGLWMDLLNLRPSSEDLDWIVALDRVDRLGDDTQLNALLATADPSPTIAKYIEDLIERRQARKGKSSGRPRKPAYAPFGLKDLLLMIAKETVRSYVRSGMSVEAAVDKVTAETGYTRREVDDAYNGRRPSLRKARKRL